jgi:hypothetical protein
MNNICEQFNAEANYKFSRSNGKDRDTKQTEVRLITNEATYRANKHAIMVAINDKKIKSELNSPSNWLDNKDSPSRLHKAYCKSVYCDDCIL